MKPLQKKNTHLYVQSKGKVIADDENLLENLHELSNIGYFTLDIEALEILEANSTLLDLLEYDGEKMPIPLDLILKNKQKLQLFVKEITNNKQIGNNELVLSTKSNSKKYVSCSGIFDASKRRFKGIVIDKTEEYTWKNSYIKLDKKNQKKLKLINQKLKTRVNLELVQINKKLQNEINERKIIENQSEKLLEELERSNKELKDFAYIVSHDLKAPLRGISSLATWIVEDYEDVLDEEGKENLALLVGRVKRMNRLIDGILQHSRVSRVKAFFEILDSKKIASEVISVLDIPPEMEITIDEDLPVITFDETHLIQILGNLIGNTLVHDSSEDGRVHIGCEDIDGYWKFYVQDNGIGIEEKHFDRIFQIFQTLKPRDEKETTGIGLSLVKKIVELRGGKVWVESEFGKGACFYFTIPNNLQIDK